jgi:NitT/TauT family transport system substrate-binding protein
MGKTAIRALVFFIFLELGWTANGRAEVINIGWTGEYWSTLPFKVALDRGFFEKEGLQVRLITFRATQLIVNAMVQGDIDYTTVLPTVGSVAIRGLSMKIVGVVAKGTGYAIVSKPEIDSLRGLKGKTFALNSFGSAPDYAVYTYLSKNGLDPNRDLTFLTIGGTSARFAALVGGSVDATVVSSPFEYNAEQQGFRTLVSMREMAEYVKLPNAGIAVTQRKIDKDPDQIIRVLRAMRVATTFIQQQREASVTLLTKTLNLSRPAADKFYPVYRDQYNPELIVPDSVLEEYLAVASFRLKDKEKEKEFVKIQALRDWSFAEKAKR